MIDANDRRRLSGAGLSSCGAQATSAVDGVVQALGPSQRERLERILSAGLVERGAVFVLSLEAIREQLASRWESRKEQVWEHVERTLANNLPVEDVFLRVDDTSMVVAVASSSAYEGQARCVVLLRRILNHFLGRSGDGDIKLSRVKGVEDGALISVAVDIQAPADPRHTTAPGQRHPKVVSPERWTPPLGGRRYAAPFTSMRGEEVALELRVAPVWCLRRGLISSYALRRVYPGAAQPQNDFDKEAADEQTVLRTVELLTEYNRFGGAFALHVPLHFSTASSRRSRIALLGLCSGVVSLMRQVVVLEVEEIGVGVPRGCLDEVVAMLRPFSRALVAGTRDVDGVNPHLREAGFRGAAIEASPACGLRLEMRSAVVRARRATPNVVVHNVAGGDTVEQELARLGASHFTAHREREREARSPIEEDMPLRRIHA